MSRWGAAAERGIVLTAMPPCVAGYTADNAVATECVLRVCICKQQSSRGVVRAKVPTYNMYLGTSYNVHIGTSPYGKRQAYAHCGGVAQLPCLRFTYLLLLDLLVAFIGLAEVGSLLPAPFHKGRIQHGRLE